jgi:hypothetical protein
MKSHETLLTKLICFVIFLLVPLAAARSQQASVNQTAVAVAASSKPLPPLGQRTQPPPIRGALAANQAAIQARKQGGAISKAAAQVNGANQPIAKNGVASVNAVTGLSGTPYAKPEAWNLDMGSCGLSSPIDLWVPIKDPPEMSQGGWATGVLNAAANLTPDTGELARLANPIDLWFGEALNDDTVQCPQGTPRRITNPSIRISLPVSLIASGLQFTGLGYANVSCGTECVPPYISEGTNGVYLARIEDCLSDADRITVGKVVDYTGNPLPCNSADAVPGKPGYWYDVAPPWSATVTLGFNDCQDAPNCVPPVGGGTVYGTLSIPAQLPVPANSLRIEIAFGVQDYDNNSFVQVYWGPNLGMGPLDSWGGPEPQALTRFAVQLEPIIVLPAAFLQMKVLPYTIVYQPPGDQSTGSYTTTQSFGTTVTLGKDVTLTNNKAFEQSYGVQDGLSVTDFVVTVQQSDGQSKTLSQSWDNSTKIGKGLTNSASHTATRSWKLGDASLLPAHDYALPNTCTQANWSVNNCVVSTAEQYNQEPFWDDRIVLLLNPQAMLWDFNGTPAVQLLGGADFDYVTTRDLATCGNSQGNGGGLTLSNGQILTSDECLQLLHLDPFADPNSGGQAYDPSQSKRGVYLGSTGYGRDPLNPNSAVTASFNDSFSYSTAQSTDGTATYNATVTNTIGFSWSSGLTLSYKYEEFGLALGFSKDTTLTVGSKTTTGTSVQTTFSSSTVATDTNATQIEGDFADDHDFDIPDCQQHSVNCYHPSVRVFLDELFGSYMFQDLRAVKALKVSKAQALPPPPALPQPSTPSHLPPQLLSTSVGPSGPPQPAPANSTILVPSNAFQGGVLTGMVLGPDNQPVPNTPVEIAGGVPVTLTGQVIGDQSSHCVPGDAGCQTTPPQTPPAPQTAKSTPPLVNCAKALASSGQPGSTPPAGFPTASALSTAAGPVLTDAAGRFALCVAPNVPTVAVNLPGGSKATVGTIANQAPPLPGQPPTFFQPGQLISVLGSLGNVVGTQNNNSWRLNTVGAWSSDGLESITTFQTPPQAQPGNLNLSYTGSDGRSHQVQASVFKILRASLDHAQLHSNQGASFEYEVQFAAQGGQSLCVEMQAAGPVTIMQQPPETIPVDSAGLGKFGGKIRATQVLPGSAVPFELTPNIHACGGRS